MKGREYYREYHERDHEELEYGEVLDEAEEEVDTEYCPYCKWDDDCKGGCTGPNATFRFERKEL